MTLEEIYEATAFDPRDRRGGAMNRPTWADGLSEDYACDAGIAALAEVVGDLNAPMPCDWAWALAVLSAPGLPTAPHVGWGVGRLVDPCDVGVVAWADLADADLADADLADADLYGAILAGADLAGASLRDADLRDADLRGANLAGADLTRARRGELEPSIVGWVVVDGRLRRATP